tara:strand:+ start:1162 stop:2580 length:1419 start_codon:yes stop_codon:yes gene_type:complete
MAADANLIQGARAVGQSMMPTNLSGLDKITQAGVDMAVGALGEKRKIEQKKVDTYNSLSEAAEKNILEGGGLGKVLYGWTTETMAKTKEDLIKGLNSGDPNAEFLAKKQISDTSAFIQDHKATVQQITSLINPETGGLGLSKYHGLDGGKGYKQLEDIVSGNFTVGENKEGQMTFKLQDGTELTSAQVKNMYEPEHIATGEEVGRQFGEITKSDYHNEVSSRAGIHRAIPDTEREFVASMHDDLGGIFGDQNLTSLLTKDFKDGNLENEIKLALGQDMYNKFDTDGTLGLSEEEKSNFIDAITNPNNNNFNLDASKAIFEDKMVQAVKNEHEKYWNLQKEKEDDKNKIKTDAATKAYQRKVFLQKLKGSNLTTKQQAQKDAEEFWGEISATHGPQDYIESFRNITGNLNVNIQHSATPFIDEQGDVVGSGYYNLMTDDNGNETKQLMAAGTKLPFDAIVPHIDYKQSKAKYD